VQEGNTFAFRAQARGLVDHSQSGGTAALQGGIQVIHRKADVVYSGSAPLDKSVDWGTCLCAFQQLDERAPGVKADYLRSVGIGYLHLFHVKNVPKKGEQILQ